MRILSARDGYKYLLPIVAAVDDDRSMSTALACCYAEAGTPRYLVRKPNQYQTGGVTASQTRHGYCPQSLMIRGVLSPSLTGIE